MTDNKIAIVGMDCRIPGAWSVNEFWDNLKNKVESISEFSKEELLESGVPIKHINNPRYVPRRGIVDGVDLFDAGFFGFTPREAELLDPQHRLFLECCWHALEDSGYSKRDEKTKVSVFGGAGTAWYLNDVYNNHRVKKYADSTTIVTSSDRDYLTTRVSYKLNLTGSSLNVQSACSTSMAAIILGVQNLLTYQSDMVLAGGVSVQYPEKKGYLFAPGSLESPDGHCRPFDKDAGGTAFSRGCGVVLLKRLEDAIEDKDNIYAVIRSGVLNNDGNKKAGFTAPSIEGQKEVIIEAIEVAEISAESISMVEAHGTATPVGDPIEFSSLSESFGYYTDKKQFCALGSVKSNIGHTDAASGVVSIIKTALSLKNKQIPASINFNSPNSKIDPENSPFFINTEHKEWENEGDRIALINSFGVGGTNACVILQEPPVIEKKKTERTHTNNFLPISAKGKDVLQNYLDLTKEFIHENKDVDIADLTYTSLVGRKHFKNRAFVTYKDRNDLLEKLDSPENIKKGICKIENRQTVFMFPGQGNQFLNMGKGLYQKYPVFKDTVDECAEILKKELQLDIRNIIFPTDDIDNAKELINQTYITQPAIFIISYAQANLLKSWGLLPDYLMGHSVGEYVAAALAGIFSLNDALIAVARRGKLIQSLPGGAMCAVLLSEEEVLPMLGNNISIGALNNSGLSVISGPYEEIEALEKLLSKKKIFNKRIPTSHAFHSAMMDPILNEFNELFNNITLNVPEIPIVSTVTGKPLTDEEATSPEYWVKHVRNTVRFSDAVSTSMDSSPAVFVEVGPGQSLESAVKRHLDSNSEHSVLSSMRTDKMNICDQEYLTNAIGHLWNYGIEVDYDLYFQDEDLSRISIPLYPFNRKSYKIESSKEGFQIIDDDDDIKEPEINKWTYHPSWKKTTKIDILLKNQKLKDENENEIEDCWLVFDDEVGVGKNIISQLSKEKQTVIRVVQRDDFKKKNDNEFELCLSKKEDYNNLISELKSEGRTPNRVIHLWNVEKNPSHQDFKTCNNTEESAFYSPLYLEQAFINNNLLNNLHISFVVNGVFEINGEKIYSPLKSLAIGPTRGIVSEISSVYAKFIDIEADVSKSSQIADQLIKETSFKDRDIVIAYRKDFRWVEFYEKVEYFEPEVKEELFKKDGVYLITGGTGGLGLEFAKHITNHTSANLILTYRTALPDRKKWDEYVKDNPENITTEKIVSIQEIEKLGSRVYLLNAEINNYDQMKKIKEFADAKFGGINGIIHSAGAAGGGIIALKTKEMADEVLKSKTRGTLIINELFSNEKLDFISLFSSITAILGEKSRVDYCAANCFLDNYAFYKNQNSKTKITSINWDSWSKVGMAARWKETQALTRRKLYENENSKIPGVHFLKEEKGRDIYQAGFNEENNWIYKEHNVMSKFTFVGTSIIDLFTKLAIQLEENKTPVISELYFFKPISIEHNEHPNIRIYVSKEKDFYKFELCILELTEVSDNWDMCATAIVRFEEKIEQKTIDFKAEMSSYTEITDKKSFMFDEVSFEGTKIVSLSKRWLNIDEKYRKGNNFILKQIIENEKDIENFIINPAILDAIGISSFIPYKVEEPYLPFNYKSIKIYDSFTKTVYSEIEMVTIPNPNSDLATMNINIYNDVGKLILEIEKYSLSNISKKIKSSNEEIKSVSDDEFILPEEGVEMFDRIYNYNNCTNVLVTPFNLFKKIKQNKEEEKDKVVEDLDSATTYERPELSSEYVAPDNEIEEIIVKIWGQILGIGQIGVNDNFNELGGNSLLVVQAVSNISEAFEIELLVDDFVQNPTIKMLSDHIMSILIEDIDDSELDALMEEIEE